MNWTDEETVVQIVCFQIFPEPKERAQSSPCFGFYFFACFLFLFSCSLSRFSFRSCQLTNWVKGLEQSSKDKLHADETGLLHELLDRSSGGSRGRAQGGPAPPLLLTKLRPESPKKFLRPAPGPTPPLSEGPDSPLHSVTLTKWISYSYILISWHLH